MSNAVSIPDLRPLSLGELLDRTFTYYRRNFWLFLGIMAIPQVFIVAMNMCLDAIQRVGVSAAGAAGSEPPGGAALGAMGGLLVGMLLMVVAYWLLYSMALGATTFAVSEVHLGRLPSVRGSYRSMKGRLRRVIDLVVTIGLRVGLIGMALVAGMVAIALSIEAFKGDVLVVILSVILAVLGMIGAVILVVSLVLRYGVAIPALLLEKLTAKEAIRRSVFLTQGNLGRVFLVVLLMTMVTWTVGAMVQGPFFVAVMILAAKGNPVAPLWLSLPMNVATGVAHAVTSPLLMIGLALLYYDARVRKEGLDLQLIMDALDQQPTNPTQP